MKTIKTRTVHFTYGTVKNAALKVPAEACSFVDMAKLIQDSYLEYMFRPGCGLMSDECLLSCIGKSNFFAGALGGYETRLSPADFKTLTSCTENDIMLASAIVTRREPNLSPAEHYLRVSQNEGLQLDAPARAAIAEMGKLMK
jgi:hypothetical protein